LTQVHKAAAAVEGVVAGSILQPLSGPTIGLQGAIDGIGARRCPYQVAVYLSSGEWVVEHVRVGDRA
jgi:hypothetical protein